MEGLLIFSVTFTIELSFNIVLINFDGRMLGAGVNIQRGRGRRGRSRGRGRGQRRIEQQLPQADMNHADDSGEEEGIIPPLIEEDPDDEDENEARLGQLDRITENCAYNPGGFVGTVIDHLIATARLPGRWYKCFMDNYYGSDPIARHLRDTRSINIVSTLQKKTYLSGS